MKEIHIPVNPKPIAASILMLAFAVCCFLAADRIPLMVSLGLLLIGLLLLFQVKRIRINPEELIVTTVLTRQTKIVKRSDINSIHTASIERNVGRSISPQSRLITVRTTSKQNITISTGSISQANFERIFTFLEQHYSEKLY